MDDLDVRWRRRLDCLLRLPVGVVVEQRFDAGLNRSLAKPLDQHSPVGGILQELTRELPRFVGDGSLGRFLAVTPAAFEIGERLRALRSKRGCHAPSIAGVLLRCHGCPERLGGF